MFQAHQCDAGSNLAALLPVQRSFAYFRRAAQMFPFQWKAIHTWHFRSKLREDMERIPLFVYRLGHFLFVGEHL